MANKNKIVICIPTKLKTRQEIASALWDKYSANYLFIGRIFQETETNESCQIDISSSSNKNSNLIQEIGLKGKGKLSSTTLQKLNDSQQIICLTSDKVGYQACILMARFTQVFLSISGSLAVSIESAEIAHEANQWLNKYHSQDTFDIYSLYVGLIEGDNQYYSCGMQNFGKPDVSIDLTEDIGLAIYIMNVFNYYRLTEFPMLQDGHTFQADIESPQYQIKLVQDNEYTIDSMQHNYWGRWHLKRYQ